MSNIRERLKDIRLERVVLDTGITSYKLFFPIFPFFERHKTIDERLNKLSKIREDLRDAITAIEDLQKDAASAKKEYDMMSQKLDKLKRDKETIDGLLGLPKEAIVDILTEASIKGQRVNWFVGFGIGIITGIISSFITWLLIQRFFT